MTNIQLNFINDSNDQNNSDVLIFQKNVATNFDELAVAWTVIQNCGQGDNHPFTFPMSFAVSASDSYGNYTPHFPASAGQAFEMVTSSSGDILKLAGEASSPAEIQVTNSLPQGAVGANIFKDGKLLAIKTGLAPAQKAVFEFKPTIWIGVVSQVVQGDIMNSAIIEQINTEISLLGIASADIVMTGGGPGPESQPFSFALENIIYA